MYTYLRYFTAQFTYSPHIIYELWVCISYSKQISYIIMIMIRIDSCSLLDFRRDNLHALLQAKYNVVKYYSVVGVLDDVPNFFHVLEKLLPQYFLHLGEHYKQCKLFQSSHNIYVFAM